MVVAEAVECGSEVSAVAADLVAVALVAVSAAEVLAAAVPADAGRM